MSKRPTAKDIIMLTDVRDRLLAAMDRQHVPRYRSGWLAPHRPTRTSDESLEVVIKCNHGVPWTSCTTCSKPRSP